jgi:hypothetical protein
MIQQEKHTTDSHLGLSSADRRNPNKTQETRRNFPKGSIMNPLCRHILPAGRPCTQPAVRSTLYCRHHQVIKRALAQVEPKPDPYGLYTPLPFVFPEDRAALQINFMLVAQALNDQSINIQMANTFNRIFRSCEINLRNGLLHETDRDKPQKQAQRRNPNEKWLVDDEDSEPQRNPHGEMVRSVVLTRDLKLSCHPDRSEAKWRDLQFPNPPQP